MQAKFLLLLLFVASIGHTVFTYKIPDVKLETLPDGFSVSIPDEPGIKYVAFNINRNRPFKGFEPGEYSLQVRDPIDNRWVVSIKRTLDTDDVIYVWVNVQHNMLIYRTIAKEMPVAKATSNVDTIDNETSNVGGTSVENKCVPTITTVQNMQNLCKGQLIFEEEFEDSISTADRWKHEIRLPVDSGDSEFVLYDSLAEVKNGILIINPKIWNDDKPGTNIKAGKLDLGARCTGQLNRLIECHRTPDGTVSNVMPPVITARINTKDSFSFKYGRIEIRAKLPRGDWLFPLLLLEPLTNHYGQNAFESGQMRIAFARGNQNLITRNGTNIDGSSLYGGAVLSLDANQRERSLVYTRRNAHYGEQFNIYSLTWTNEKLVFKVNDQEFGELDGGFSHVYSTNIWNSGGRMAPFDQEFYITLGVSAGGHGDFPEKCLSNSQVKPWDNTSPKGQFKFWQKRHDWMPTWISPSLQVDYVRVYAI